MIDAKSLPQMKIPEIREYLQEMGVAVSERDLREPTPERMMHIYEFFVERITGIPKERIRQPRLMAVDVNDDQHQEITQIYRLNRYMCSIMPWTGIHDFQLADITLPEPQRIPRVLGALINYSLFKQALEDKNRDRFYGYRENLEAVRQSNATAEQAEQAVLAKRRQLEEQEAAAQRIVATNEQLYAEAKALDTTQAELQLEVHRVKRDEQEIKDQVANTEFALQELCTLIEELKTQIVDNPDDVQRRLREIEVEEGREREDRARLRQALLDKQRRVAAWKNVHTAAEKVLEEADRVCETANHLVASARDVDDVNRRLEVVMEANAQQRKALKELQHDYEQRQEERKRTVKAMDARKDEEERRMARLMDQRAKFDEVIAQHKGMCEDMARKHQINMEELTNRLLNLQIVHREAIEQLMSLVSKSADRVATLSLK
eukprot:comp11818_c0_seq1/m.6440 comp11818_c0_seq1/g.6440  ORF comp11818_c0_seq1/g.6440 comp11818_c0_seq1/m.6440 type:complete len:434 (-) comp11818_c0_seq1:511-1812(-)